jgi:glycosyltransferase involved in cell wall biosynthesis
MKPIEFSQFSVLMSLYEKESPVYLEECLNSLYLQSVQADEIVIVFDGPLPSSLINVVENWKSKIPIREVKIHQNVGLGKALNIGLKECKYELVARMDTDDICNKDRFKKQLSLFVNNTDISICGSYIDEFVDNKLNVINQRKVPITSDVIYQKCSKSNPFNHMTVMYKKSDIINSGSYQHLPWMEDWYLWLRLLAKGYKGQNINESLVYARVGNDMLGRRSGFQYIKSEWLLTKVKLSLELTNVFSAILIFLIRSIPRLLPRFLLSKVYSFSRRNNG